MKNLKLKELAKWVIKLGITSVALWFVFKKVDFQAFKESILNTQLGYYFLALLAFNASKIVAALRFREFLRALGIDLPNGYNLRLSYIGMFYNLFLPGSIGGDGYKVYILKQSHKETKTGQLVAASLLDRISGLALLFVLTCLLIVFSALQGTIPYLTALAITLGAAVLPCYYLATRWFFPSFLSAFVATNLHSLWVQIGQVVSAWLLLLALGINSAHIDYLTLFMMSSVVAVLPFTIGGVGARELVFIYGYNFLPIEEGKAIAFTLLFFSVTALSSLIGLPFTFARDTYQKQEDSFPVQPKS